MTRDTDDDEVWRAIVENYGDRIDLGPEPQPEVESRPEIVWPHFDEPVPAVPTSYDDEDTFVPPAPPPLPVVPKDRLAAWIGMLGSPAVLLLCLVAGISVSGWLELLLILGFVGGFLYLVVRMPRGPRDPFDDGARL